MNINKHHLNTGQAKTSFGNSSLAAAVLRIYYTCPVAGPCDCCGRISRLAVVDLDRRQPICRDCVPATLQAAEALRAAGLVPPHHALVESNP